MILKGIPEYNCWFNKSKLKTNFQVSNITESEFDKIEFLGWKINSKTFEVEPKYSPARYSTRFVSLDYS